MTKSSEFVTEHSISSINKRRRMKKGENAFAGPIWTKSELRLGRGREGKEGEGGRRGGGGTVKRRRVVY